MDIAATPWTFEFRKKQSTGRQDCETLFYTLSFLKSQMDLHIFKDRGEL